MLVTWLGPTPFSLTLTGTETSVPAVIALISGIFLTIRSTVFKGATKTMRSSFLSMRSVSPLQAISIEEPSIEHFPQEEFAVFKIAFSRYGIVGKPFLCQVRELSPENFREIKPPPSQLRTYALLNSLRDILTIGFCRCTILFPKPLQDIIPGPVFRTLLARSRTCAI